MSVTTPAGAAAKLALLQLRVATPFTANIETTAAIDAGASLLKTLLAAAAPRKTGAYAGSITARTRVTGTAAFIMGEGARPLTGWLIQGTKPHLIAPKTKRALFWPEAAHPVALVHHPGTKPNPWHVTPSEAAADQLGALVADAMVRSLANAI